MESENELLVEPGISQGFQNAHNCVVLFGRALWIIVKYSFYVVWKIIYTIYQLTQEGCYGVFIGGRKSLHEEILNVNGVPTIKLQRKTVKNAVSLTEELLSYQRDNNLPVVHIITGMARQRNGRVQKMKLAVKKLIMENDQGCFDAESGDAFIVLLNMV